MYVYLWQEPIQYDGTNGSYIVNTWLGGAPYSIISDTGTVLTIAVEDSNNRVVVLNGWLIKGWGNSLSWNGTNAEYLDRYVEVPPRVEMTLAAGYAITPSITGSGGTSNVAVDLNTTMSGTAYEATAVLAGTSALLTDLEITDMTITDSNTVTVEVTNNGGAALAGATVIVTAGELTT